MKTEANKAHRKSAATQINHRKVRSNLTEGSKKALRDFDPICAVSYYAYLMTPPFLDLLKRTDGGAIIYEPFRRGAEGLHEFQDKMHRLQEMERPGRSNTYLCRGERTGTKTIVIR